MKPVFTGRRHSWPHYVMPAYLGTLFWQPMHHHAGLKEWLLTVLGVVVFLALYGGVLWLKEKTWQMVCLAGIVLAGLAFTPMNGGAECFFIFAACTLPHVVETESGVVKFMAMVLAVIGLQTWWLHMSMWFLVSASGVSVLSAITSFHFHQRDRMYQKLKLANAEIEHLAKVAERERIARDLHDVLGHTLSVIILKSELAGKLMEHDPERAKAEIHDVEETSRAALSEVRSTIRGYRVHSLEAELIQARAALETAGVAVITDATQIPLSPAQENVVALVVREAVTNIVRHAHAQNCYLRLAPVNGNCRLEVQDDGCGGPQVEGHGIRGMRERIEALGGRLERDTNAGTRMTIEFPLTSTKGKEQS